MKRVTFATPDPLGAYIDLQNNRFSLTSGMYDSEQIASMTNVWQPGLEEDSIVLGEPASSLKTIGVCYWNIDQAIQWLGLRHA
jgi:hypothetical protein